MVGHKRELKNKLIEIWGREPESLDDLADCCIAVINQWFVDKREDNKVVGFAWDIWYDPKVSNSHNCPIDAETNWNRTDDKPLGYPGFYGRVWIRYAKPVSSSGFNAFQSTLTYPGTGGGGAYGGPWASLSKVRYQKHGNRKGPDMYPAPAIHSWDYCFFVQDFEGIMHWINWLILQDKPYKQHIYKWEDPNIKLADLEFISSAKLAK